MLNPESTASAMQSAVRFLGLFMFCLLFAACAFQPRQLDVQRVEGQIALPKGTFDAQYEIDFAPVSDRRPSKTDFGVIRNKLMMVTAPVSMTGSLSAAVDMMVRKNFEAVGIKKGATPLIVKSEILEAHTDLPGPDHLFVRIRLSLAIVDKKTNVPVFHEVFTGYSVVGVIQTGNVGHERAFVEAMNQISDQVHNVAVSTSQYLADSGTGFGAKVAEVAQIQEMSQAETKAMIGDMFDEGIRNFTVYYDQPRRIVTENIVSPSCSADEASCTDFENKIVITTEYGGALIREDMVFANDRYIGSRLHAIGIPHVVKAAHLELRKLQVTHPNIDFYFEPIAEDEGILWIAYDVAALANELGVSPDSGNQAGTDRSSGTGFFVDYKGHIVTNNHVLEECQSINVAVKDELLPAAVVLKDNSNDLAVLQVDIVPEIIGVFRRGEAVRVGEQVYAVGFPLTDILSDQAKITAGMVNSRSGLDNDTRMLQISAPVQPGNSGGPLLDRSGNIVGVVTSKLDAIEMAKYTGDVPQNINFAIKSSLVQSLLQTSGVAASVAPTKKEISSVAIFDTANIFTVLIVCTH